MQKLSPLKKCSPIKAILNNLILVLIGVYSFVDVKAQTISTYPTWTANNGNGYITFNIQNTNAYPITITEVGGPLNSLASSTAQFWLSPSSTSTVPPTAGNLATSGWTALATQTFTPTIGNSTTPEPVLTNLSIVVAANTTIRVAITVFASGCTTGRIRYFSIPTTTPSPVVFSNAGVNLISGAGIGYAATSCTQAPINNRGFVGYINFINSTTASCSTVTTPPTIDVESNVDSICSGTSANFSLNTTLPVATGFTYQWQSATAPTGPWTNLGTAQTTAPLTATNITASRWYKMQLLCNNTVLRNSDSFFVFVRPTPVPTAAITANPGTNICANTPVTFTATTTNGGTVAQYQWKLNNVNVGTNSPSYMHPSLANGDQVAVVYTSSALCANPQVITSNALSMTVGTMLTPQVTIVSNPSSNQICSGTPVTFTATPVNGGTPIYHWLINGVPVGTNNPIFTSNTLVNNDNIRVIMTSSVPCKSKPSDTSNALTFFVNSSLTPDINITSSKSNNTACKNETVMFTAQTTHGGIGQLLAWKINGISVGANNSNFYTNALNNGDIVHCELHSDILCRTKDVDSSNAIIMTINNNPLPVITKSGNQLATSIYSTYQWYKDGLAIAGASNQTYSVQQPGNYWVRVQDQNSCEGESTPLWVPYILGVSHVYNNDLKLYPNPTAEGLHVQYKEAVNVELRNVMGQIIFQQNNCNYIPMDKLADGYYLVEVSDKNDHLIAKEKIQKVAR